MYADTVTLFNYYNGIWRANVLAGVDLNVDRAALIARLGAETKDRALLHIKYAASPVSASGILFSPSHYDGVLTQDSFLFGTNGFAAGEIHIGSKTVVEPKAYVGDPDTITFRSGEDGENPDFFIASEWSLSETVDDSDYASGFLDYMLETYDGVYAITSVARYSVIPHYEVTAG